MTNKSIRYCFSAFAILCTQGALAQTLPAVSDVNGRVEFNAGALSTPNSFLGSAAGSLSVPLGDRFGAQFDASIHTSLGTSGGGALHLFTRDPDSYLAGITGAVVRTGVGTIGAVGGEAELYFGDFSIEAWAGVAGIDYDAAAAIDKTGFFALADLAYYPTEDLRLSLGASSILGYEAVRFGAEYQVNAFDTPFSLTGKVQLGEDGAVAAQAGVRFYFGGQGNSLAERHRRDDPPNRSLDLFGSAGSQTTDNGVVPPPPAPGPPV